MKEVLRQLLGQKDERKPADESLFLSGRNYLNPQMPAPLPEKTQLPPVPTQVGPVAGLVTVNDNGQIFQLAPGEVYEGGIRIIPGPAPTFTGLLDDYPGAAAAYSLRRLATAYTGPLVQVRRASDNDETTIPYKDDGTLDVAVLNAFAAGTDAFVSEWPDQSTNESDALQTSTSAQPKIYDASTGIILDGGKPALSFNGTSSYLQITSPASINTTNNLSAFAVNSPNDISANVIVSKWETSTSIRPWIFVYVSSNLRLALNNNDLKLNVSTTARKQLSSFVYNKSSNVIAIDGTPTSFTYSSNLQNAPSVDVLIGAERPLSPQAFFSGPIQEVILYPSDQSTNRTGIETNINDFYSIY